jgi:two-component sensor histidine kinase
LSPGAVALDLRIGKVSLDVDQAIPCGLILNELVTNSLRHAFPGGRQGTLQVSLDETAGGLVQLAVRDDGVGMSRLPSATSTSSLGWQLVSLFTEQLGGVVTCAADAGTSVRIEFSRRVRAKHGASAHGAA